MTDTTDAAALAGMVENALRMAMTTITGQDDDWEEIAMAQIEAGIDHAAALVAQLAEAEQRAARLRDAYLAAETRIMADAEAQVVGSLASRVAGLYAQRDCRRTLQPDDLAPEGQA